MGLPDIGMGLPGLPIGMGLPDIGMGLPELAIAIGRVSGLPVVIKGGLPMRPPPFPGRPIVSGFDFTSTGLPFMRRGPRPPVLV